MEKSYIHECTKFSPETIRAARDAILEVVPEDTRNEPSTVMSVSLRGATWRHDDIDEFFADYRDEACSKANFYFGIGGYKSRCSISLSWASRLAGGDWEIRSPDTQVTVVAPSRRELVKIATVLDDSPDVGAIPKFEAPAQSWEKKVTIFIGHGRDPAWRVLSDALEKKHSFRTEAFEFGANAGHTVRSVLEKHLIDSALALLVMTAEDPDSEGLMHARENVIHEAGLFQGRLGFDRAIVLLEEGCQEFSNIHGLVQIRFAPGAIEAVVGDVLATLRREFDPAYS